MKEDSIGRFSNAVAKRNPCLLYKTTVSTKQRKQTAFTENKLLSKKLNIQSDKIYCIQSVNKT